ncbi:hypothetical protein HPB48_026018 [Haemaphysalis longicornis]|uniref:Uncharacterized protein n=1 Tax=Haemaphysalis longicornis TaxID=44386 RepID=A0A9J6H8J3_HAELO|nr:hypothetical protein HPB48_026018 [Haemaphysalis longicornis]
MARTVRAVGRSIKLQRTHRSRRRAHRRCVRVGFLNMNGARRTQKWAELYRALEEEGMSVMQVAETHFRDEEQPPIHQDWCWTGQNRSGNDRKGGGVGLLWRRGLRWKRQYGECRDHLWAVGELLGVPTAVCVLYLSVVSTHQAANAELLACVLNDARKVGQGPRNNHYRRFQWSRN